MLLTEGSATQSGLVAAKNKMTKITAPPGQRFDYLNQYQADSDVARTRYMQNFNSNIFDGPSQRIEKKDPPGKRRDQTNSELFGRWEGERDLRKAPDTFEPRVDPRSPRAKKQAFLASDVLPKQQPAPVNYYGYPNYSEYGVVQDGEIASEEERAYRMAMRNANNGLSHGLGENSADPNSKSQGIVHFEENNDIKINHAAAPEVRRQQELESNLFGHSVKTGHGAEGEEETSKKFAENKIVPGDFSWFNNPRKPETFHDDKSSKDRVYEGESSIQLKY